MTNNIKFQALLLAILFSLSMMTYTKLGETIALVAAISMIGLPITLLLFALPTISAAIAALIITQALGRLVGLSSGWVFGAPLCVGFCHLPEYVFRPAAETEAAAMLAQDTGWDGRFTPMRIALLDARPGGCYARCRDLLAEGAEAVFIPAQKTEPWQQKPITGDMPSLSFTMRTEGNCDPVLDAFRRAQSGVKISRFDRDECFQKRAAVLDEMEMAIWDGNIHRPSGTHWVEALRRARMFRRAANGWQVEEQVSQVTYRSVTNAILTRWGGYGMEIKFEPEFNWKRITIGQRIKPEVY
ncbi:hypothetical protein [Ruegeria lacuscaerulensis]|uniref:hypothetical protein n=1 Tax=Ruegeria lacuscaerulensis TaxID=55218 RepID=UPI00147A1BBB|nr:hypothetical protein [Ruegeria lacuscaerulensis]